MSTEIEKGLSDDLVLFGNDLFDTISSREITPIAKLDAYNKLLKLLKSTADHKKDFLYVSGLLQRSFFWGFIDGYIEGIREYEDINRTIEGLIDVSYDREFETSAREVIEENSKRRLLNLHGRQYTVNQ